MPLTFHLMLPPVLLTLLVAWVAGGFWAERHLHFHGSLIREAIAFISYLFWMLLLIAQVVLLGGSVLGLFYRLFIEGGA